MPADIKKMWLSSKIMFGSKQGESLETNGFNEVGLWKQTTVCRCPSVLAVRVVSQCALWCARSAAGPQPQACGLFKETEAAEDTLAWACESLWSRNWVCMYCSDVHIHNASKNAVSEYNT